MIFWLTSSRHSTKLNIAYSYFTSYNLTRKDPLSAGLFLSVQQFHPSMMAKISAILSIGKYPPFSVCSLYNRKRELYFLQLRENLADWRVNDQISTAIRRSRGLIDQNQLIAAVIVDQTSGWIHSQ